MTQVDIYKFDWKALFIFIVICSFFFASCFQDAEELEEPDQLKFFNLEGYFKNEVNRLKKINRIRKTVNVNNQTESKDLEGLNFEKELSVFKEADINKTAWLNKYIGDTTYISTNKNKIKQIIYTTLDSSLQIKRIEIDFLPDRTVEQIFVLKSSDSAIAKTKKELRYRPNEGYNIISQQKVRFSKDRLLKVEVAFLE